MTLIAKARSKFSLFFAVVVALFVAAGCGSVTDAGLSSAPNDGGGSGGTAIIVHPHDGGGSGGTAIIVHPHDGGGSGGTAIIVHPHDGGGSGGTAIIVHPH